MRTRVRSLRSDALDELVVRWAPPDLEGLFALVDHLTEGGVGRARAVGIAEWLARRVVAREDHIAPSHAVLYRRVLRELEERGYHAPIYSGVAQLAEQAAVNR